MAFSTVKEAHQGNYSVMAKNSQGENSSSMHLTVYSKFLSRSGAAEAICWRWLRLT